MFNRKRHEWEVNLVFIIDSKFKSHLHLEKPDAKKVRTSDVSEGEGYEIQTYPELVKSVAKIAHWNRRYCLFFRGQEADYTRFKKSRGELGEHQSTLRPTYFRPGEGKKTLTMNHRLARKEILEKCCDRLIDTYKFEGSIAIKRYKELQWALIQHYEICPTPLIDLTQSLRVAASISHEGNSKNKFAYVYVLGLPHPNGSITYAVDEDIMIMKLQSICPPEASRPHFQEGYLAGSFPPSEKSSNYEFRRRLLAKFRLNRTKFWSKDFRPIPKNALMPKDDSLLRFFEGIKSDLNLDDEDVRKKMGLV